jgi:3',5'-cyclic-AMP phosphodiesterase
VTVTLVQITDCHLLADGAGLLRGWPVAESLGVIVEAVAAVRTGRVGAHRLLLSGDLADSGEPEAYRQLLDILEPLGLPIHWLPGNHDGPGLGLAMAGSRLADSARSVCLGSWRLLLLDSVLAGSPIGEGALSESSWRWLGCELEKGDQPAIIALHHPPLATGLDWVDQMQLRDGDRFHQLMAHYPQVKLVVFGHIHAELHRRIGAVDYYGCPSTCTQVESLDRANSGGNQPGFRVIELADDGQFRAWVDRVEFAMPVF